MTHGEEEMKFCELTTPEGEPVYISESMIVATVKIPSPKATFGGSFERATEIRTAVGIQRVKETLENTVQALKGNL